MGVSVFILFYDFGTDYELKYDEYVRFFASYCYVDPDAHTIASVAEFDREVGLSFLRGMHINDSKGALGSKKDRHENIGLYARISQSWSTI